MFQAEKIKPCRFLYTPPFFVITTAVPSAPRKMVFTASKDLKDLYQTSRRAHCNPVSFDTTQYSYNIIHLVKAQK